DHDIRRGARECDRRASSDGDSSDRRKAEHSLAPTPLGTKIEQEFLATALVRHVDSGRDIFGTIAVAEERSDSRDQYRRGKNERKRDNCEYPEHGQPRE